MRIDKFTHKAQEALQEAQQIAGESGVDVAMRGQLLADRLEFRRLHVEAQASLRDLLADRHNRIERGHRLLKDHRKLTTPDPPDLLSVWI